MVLVLAAGGCARRVQSPPAEAIQSRVEAKSARLNADVFYDATPSMRGFTAGGEGASYVRVIRKLESAVNKEWPGAEVKLFAFGSTVSRLPDQDRLAPLRSDFYKATAGTVDTFIDRAIERADPANLTIITTDLFQTDTDVTRVTKLLIDKYVRARMALGILGLKAGFTGEVYDVGIERRTFHYEGPRPFYVLVLGKYSDVEGYFQSLEADELGNNSDAHFLILSPYILHALPVMRRAALRDTTHLDAINELVIPGQSSDYVQQFRVLKNATTASYRITAPLDLTPFRMAIDTSAVEPRIAVQRLAGAQFTEAGPSGPALDVKQLQVVQTRGEKLQRQLGMSIELNTAAMQPGVVYRCDVKLIPSARAYKLPQWVHDWDMDVTRVPAWKADPKSFDGATTLNLARFVEDVWQASVRVNQPLVARFFCYLRKG